MSFERKSWLWLSLIIVFSLGFLSLKPTHKVMRRATAYQDRASRAPHNRGVFRSETRNVTTDFIVEEDFGSSKLHKDFLRTEKRMDLSDDSGPLGMHSNDSWYRRKLSFVDFSPVLNM